VFSVPSRRIQSAQAIARTILHYGYGSRVNTEGLRALARNLSVGRGTSKAFRAFAARRYASARTQFWKDAEFAEEGNHSILLFFVGIADILRERPNSSLLERSSLNERQRWIFDWAFECLAGVAKSKKLDRELTEIEVSRNSASATTHSILLSSNYPNRLFPLLTSDSDDDRDFAIGLLEKLHSRNVGLYDSVYSVLPQAKSKAKSAKSKLRIDRIKIAIERNNPLATIPVLAVNLSREVAKGAKASVALARIARRSRLSQSEKAMLAGRAAMRALRQTRAGASKELLAVAASFSDSSPLLRAWALESLGDSQGSANVLTSEALRRYRGSPRRIDELDSTRAHIVMLALRQLFRLPPGESSEGLRDVRKTFSRARDKLSVGLVDDFLAYEDGWKHYLRRRRAKSDPRHIPTGEGRIRRRAESTRLLVDAALSGQRRLLRRSVRLFEESAIGNDAPWIKGSRALFTAAQLLTSRAASRFGSKESIRVLSRATRLLDSASQYFRCNDPSAVGLGLKGLSRGARGYKLDGIRDISGAVALMDCRTPELSEIHKILATSMQDFAIAHVSGSELNRRVRKAWSRLALLIPLLDEVFDADHRIAQQVKPFFDLEMAEPQSESLEGIQSISNTNDRGRALEEMMSRLIAESGEFRLVSVNHSNDYEEIDLVVQVMKQSPVFASFGPFILVECKNWRSRVGTPVVGLFYSKMSSKRELMNLGLLVSPSGFTRGVKLQVPRLPGPLVLTVNDKDLSSLIRAEESLGTLIERRVMETVLS